MNLLRPLMSVARTLFSNGRLHPRDGPELGGCLVVFHRDDGPDSSTNVPVPDDLRPSRVDSSDDVVEDSVRDVLVEGSFVPV